MTQTDWALDESDGELVVHTGVTGRAAKVGHSLTIAMTSWQATLSFTDGEPTAAVLVVDVGSFHVLRGDGGLTPLSGPEKGVVRSNALKSLAASRFPQIRFHSAEIRRTDDGRYRLAGTLTIRGKNRPGQFEMSMDDVGTARRLSGSAEVRQSDFGVKPFSMLAGSLKVVDTVTVSVTVMRSK